jgi:predicted DNA-binding transcriptional regulator AlpA
MRLISYDDLSSKGVHAWVESEIDQWIAERIRERDGTAA